MTTLLLMSFLCYGVFSLTGEGELLGRPRIWLAERLPEWLMKPICNCTMCMSSIWGTAVYWLLESSLTLWPLYVVSCCGLNYIIGQWVPFGRSKKN